MSEPENAPSQLSLVKYRSYLLLLARLQLDDRGRGAIDPSDIVQQTLLEAHRCRGQFVGEDAALLLWLRRALANNLRDALRRVRRQKRDVRRERSLDDAVEGASQRLAECLAVDQSSPSRRVIRAEELLHLADALLALPDAQREAVVLHHLHGWTLAEVAEQLDRTDAAVAGLLHRGLRKLRKQLAGGTAS